MNDFLAISVLFLSFIFLISLASSYLFFLLGFSRIKKTWLRRSKDIKNVDYSAFRLAEPWLFEQNPQDLWITSKEGLKLHAYYLPSKTPPKQIVILHHGYTSQGRNMALFARFYHEHFEAAILAIDMRAHGQSEGKYLGFGWLEKEDTPLWIDTMNTLIGSKPPVILHGISLGASTVLNLAGNACPDQVKIIIADSGFSDLKRQFKRQFKEIFHLPSFPLIPLGSMWCKLFLGFSFKTASPIQYASKIKIPTLIIHGLQDMFVPHPMSNDLYKALTCTKKLVHYANAPHALTYPNNKQDYEREVLTFIKENLT
jgi:uncharacterized protein